MKAAGIAREQSRRTVAVATVIMDRIIGLWGLCWLVALLGGLIIRRALLSRVQSIGQTTAAIVEDVGVLPPVERRFGGSAEAEAPAGGSAATGAVRVERARPDTGPDICRCANGRNA